MLSCKCHLQYLGERQAERLLQLGVFFLKSHKLLVPVGGYSENTLSMWKTNVQTQRNYGRGICLEG